MEALVKVPIEMSGVCTKPAATVAKEAEEASSAFVACEEVPVRVPTKVIEVPPTVVPIWDRFGAVPLNVPLWEPVKEPVKEVLVMMPVFW